MYLPRTGLSAQPSPTFPACCGASSALPPLAVKLHPSKTYAEVLIPPPQDATGFGNGLYRGEQAMMRSAGWPEPNMTSVLIRGTGKQRQTCSEEKEHGCDEREGRRHMEIRGAPHRPRDVWATRSWKRQGRMTPPNMLQREQGTPPPPVVSHSWTQN